MEGGFNTVCLCVMYVTMKDSLVKKDREKKRREGGKKSAYSLPRCCFF